MVSEWHDSLETQIKRVQIRVKQMNFSMISEQKFLKRWFSVEYYETVIFGLVKESRPEKNSTHE